MVTLCHVFRVHRSSYRYWKNRPEKPDGRRAVLRSQVLELHGISHGSAGARSIATMATRRGYQMGRWLAGRLMKELGLVSCQQPTHRYKRGGHEHVAIPKSNSKQRPLGSPALRDCIVQRAMLMAMGPRRVIFIRSHMVFDLCEMSTTRSAR